MKIKRINDVLGGTGVEYISFARALDELEEVYTKEYAKDVPSLLVLRALEAKLARELGMSEVAFLKCVNETLAYLPDRPLHLFGSLYWWALAEVAYLRK